MYQITLENEIPEGFTHVFNYYVKLRSSYKKIMNLCEYIYLYIESNKVNLVRFRARKQHKSQMVSDNLPQDNVYCMPNQPHKLIIQITQSPFNATIYNES